MLRRSSKTLYFCHTHPSMFCVLLRIADPRKCSCRVELKEKLPCICTLWYAQALDLWVSFWSPLSNSQLQEVKTLKVSCRLQVPFILLIAADHVPKLIRLKANTCPNHLESISGAPTESFQNGWPDFFFFFLRGSGAHNLGGGT